MKQNIESTRSILNELVSDSNAMLHEGEILQLSIELDMLIAIYYEESSI